MNGDHLECVKILHIGDNGAVVAPAVTSFPNLSVADLLDAWLNDDFVRLVPRQPGERLRVEIPHPVKGVVFMVVTELDLAGEHYFPITHVGDQRVFAQWPPRSDIPATVSPELESARASSDTPKGSLPVRFVWSAPFDELQPLVISPDDVYARDKMRQIAEVSGKNFPGAQAQAATEAREWISEGRTTLNEVWLQPILAAEDEQGALIAIDSRFGISAGSLEQACKNVALREQLSAPISVMRAWGVPGLMWALLLDRLSRAQVHRVCQRCRELISGRGHKRYCSASDNQKCFQARKADDRRRSRARESIRK